MFDHDDFGRVIAEKWFSVDGKVDKTLAFDYNVLGHLTKVNDGVAVFDYSRDEDGRELTATMTLPGLQNPIVQNTEYDVLGRRTRIATAFGAETGFANEYAYDALGRMTGIVQGDKRVEYAYNAASQRTATSVFAGTGKVFDGLESRHSREGGNPDVKTLNDSRLDSRLRGNDECRTSLFDTLYQYDGMGRLTQIKHGDIAQYDFSWDTANRITSMNDAQYGYDQTSQLVSAEYETLPKELYEYDANGNRKAYETGKNNQLLNDGVFAYTYDDEGNRVSKVSKNSKTEYAWDHRNRLVRVVDNGKSVVYDYDYQNRLVRRNDELFVHDGWQIACSLRNGKVEHRYLWGATQDELLAIDDMWTLRDHLNTVRKVVDAEGCVISSLEYNAFGVLMNATGEKPLFRYTGKMFDDATGLQWNINRWYDANVGRWISEDPIGFRAGDTCLYRYVVNSPIVYSAQVVSRNVHQSLWMTLRPAGVSEPGLGDNAFSVLPRLVFLTVAGVVMLGLQQERILVCFLRLAKWILISAER